jgi:hypothetical protein
LSFRTHPAIGWVKADGYNDTELLKRLADLQTRYDELSRQAQVLREKLNLSIDAARFAQGEDRVELEFSIDPSLNPHYARSVALSWDEIFFGLGNTLITPAEEREIDFALRLLIRDVAGSTESPRLQSSALGPSFENIKGWRISPISFKRVLTQLLALGLIESEVLTNVITDSTKLLAMWRLSELGR